MPTGRPPRRLITIAHSYAVALNRRLAHELARAGGDEWAVTAVAPAFIRGDLRPVPFEPGDGREPYRLEVVPSHFTWRNHVMLYGRKLRALLREPFDMVHCWEEPYVLAGGQIAWWTPRRTAFVFQTFQNLSKRYPPPFGRVERFVVDRCTGWLAGGESIAEAMLPRGYGRKPYRIVPLGVAVDRFYPDPEAGVSVRRRLGWEEPGPPVVGYLGRFVVEKGVSLLMRALDGVRAPWRALFVGGGPLEDELRAWGERHGDRVRVVTKVAHDAVPAHLNAMDLLAAPSQTTPQWREQLGRMLIEAFACGVPVVASDSGEIPHVVDGAGLVVAENDQPAWEQALGDLLESHARRTELAERGLERARSVYAWSVVARRHLDFYNELLD
jgi:glycosyltransferase involved in cell wall biosynthesis